MRVFPLFKMNSFTIVDNSFCSLVASEISSLLACGSLERRIGRSYLEKKEEKGEKEKEEIGEERE